MAAVKLERKSGPSAAESILGASVCEWAAAEGRDGHRWMPNHQIDARVHNTLRAATEVYRFVWEYV